MGIRHFFPAALALAALAPGAPVLAQEVGVMTAFQTLITREGVTLAVGSGISLGDLLISNETGLGMIVFDDESSAKIGPNASLVIDSFVYDPQSGTGSSNILLNSGLIRLYGGQISHNGDMTVETPHVVLGARGGIIEILTEAFGTFGILRAGQLTCILGDKIVVISNPGFGCSSDGEEMTVEQFDAEFASILDSLDEIAGAGVPGDPGGGFDTEAICASAIGDMLSFCQGADNSSPGGGGGGLPDTPQGGGTSCGPCEVEVCDGGCFCVYDPYCGEG